MTAPVVLLQVVGPDAGPWTVTVGEPGTPAATGELPPAAIDALLEAIEVLLRPRPGRPLVPGRDRRQVRAEAQVGQLLLETCSTSPALTRAWGVAAAALSGDNGGVVVVDARPTRARDLPWELLAHTPDAPPMAFAARVVVARLTPGPRPSHPAPGVPIPTVWRLSAGEDAVAALVESGLQDAWGSALAEPSVEHRSWLHLIAHGDVDPTEGPGLQLGDRDTDGTALADQLAPHLRRAVVTMLAVCHAGRSLHRRGTELPAQLVRAGAPLVVAAQSSVSPEALTAFSSGLAAGPHASVLDAVAAGWRSVRRAALPWPDARWHRLRIFVSRAGSVLQPLTPASSPLTAHLDRARAHANTLLSGFFGIEHLLLALSETPVEPSLAALRYQATVHHDQVRAQLGALQPQHTDRPADWTPRLRDLLAALSDDAGLEALWRPLLASAGPIFAALLDLPLGGPGAGGSFDTVGTARHAAPTIATHLEVVGGPEDGRTFTPAPGDWIGRPSRSAPSTWNLYAHTPLVDPRVSRQHVQWLGPGRLLCRRTVLVAGRPVTGELLIHDGTVLQVGGATRLVGRSKAPSVARVQTRSQVTHSPGSCGASESSPPRRRPADDTGASTSGGT